MPLEVKFQEAKKIAAPFFAKDGIPTSEQQGVLEQHNFEAARSDLDELLSTRAPTDPSAKKIIQIAKDKGGITPEHVRDLEQKIEVASVQEKLKKNERVVKAEEGIMQDGLPGVIPWKFSLFPQKEPVTKKAKAPMKRSGEEMFDSYVKIVNNKLPDVMAAKTDPETVKTRVFEAFQDYLNLYWQMLANATPLYDQSDNQRIVKAQKDYDQYSADRDPASGLFSSYFGHEWSEKFLYGFLFEDAKPLAVGVRA
jgi:hypothetical protein